MDLYGEKVHERRWWLGAFDGLVALTVRERNGKLESYLSKGRGS
jgi:hypothetical protein